MTVVFREWYQCLANFSQRPESGCCREVEDFPNESGKKDWRIIFDCHFLWWFCLYILWFWSLSKSFKSLQVNVLVISEVTARSVSMKLRRTSVLKRRQQNVKDFKKREHGSFGKNAASTRPEISSVLLSSDTDSSQSDENVIDLTLGSRKRVEDEDETHAFVKSQTNSSGAGQKISLSSSAMAEDTLGKLRVMSNTTVPQVRSSSPLNSERDDVEQSESAMDEFSGEFTVESGPSSPNPDVNTARCRECESLFSKMRRRTPSKTKNRDKSKHLSFEK